MQLCTIEITDPSLVPWLERRSFIAPLAGIENLPAGDDSEVIVRALPDDSANWVPLISRRNGSVRVHFDVAATIDTIRREAYPGAALALPLVARLPFDYQVLPKFILEVGYRLLNRPADLARLPRFPNYPQDFSADILQFLQSAQTPLTWPDGKRYAVTFTHDVDDEWIFADPDGRRWLERFVAAEEESNTRSAWYCVPLAMNAKGCATGLSGLVRRGHEVGVHGWKHDPALHLLSTQEAIRRFSAARDMLRDFDPVGYRAPWLSRSPSMHDGLEQSGYLYDTSVPTADFHRANRRSNNGCGTHFPFSHGNLTILPITLPQDFMMSSTGKNPEQFWDWILELAMTQAAAGGIIMVSTHIQPHFSASERMLAGYRRVVQALTSRQEAWVTLPRTIAERYQSRQGHSTEQKSERSVAAVNTTNAGQI